MGEGKTLVHLPVPLLLVVFSACSIGAYEPNWKSLDTRPIPEWYDEAKLGIFIHWGVFSVPGFFSEWFWHEWHEKRRSVVEFMEKNYRPDFTYADFANQFRAEFFDADEWVKLFEESGAKYIVFTSKHHEGFTNWPSKRAFSWNSMAVGPKKDIVGELRNATLKRKSLRFGLYHSLYEWYNPLYLADKTSGFKTQDFVNDKTMPELYEIVNRYQPEVIYSDGDWEANDTYWKSTDFLAWLYNSSPVKDTVVVNDRWGIGTSCRHGDTYTCEDKYDPGVLQKHKWVNAMTLDNYSWGYRRTANIQDFLTTEEMLQVFVRTISCGGNMLMNVGPESDGKISPIYQERLKQMGAWLKVNGEGIYGSKPWTFQNDTLTKGVWYTTKPNSSLRFSATPGLHAGRTVYVFLYNWPKDNTVSLALPKLSPTSTVSLLGYGRKGFTFRSHPVRGVDITVPDIPVSRMPNLWLWCLKLTRVLN